MSHEPTTWMELARIAMLLLFFGFVFYRMTR